MTQQKIINQIKKIYEEKFEDEIEKTINFRIISRVNEEIYQEGYVEIPKNVEEQEEWFYYNQSGMVQPRMFTHHDGIGIKQIGATFEQEQEISEFLQEVQYDYVDWINDVILNSEEDEHRTFQKGDITLIINEGAKMECTIEDAGEFGEYFVKVIPYFNGGKRDDLISFIDKHDDFDPYGGFEGDYQIINNELIFEISKDYFDEEEKEEQIEIILEEFRRIFARELVYELGISSNYGEQVEEFAECLTSNKELFKLSQVTNENLHQFLIDEGIIGEDK